MTDEHVSFPTRQAVSPPANDKSSEPVALTASEINRAMGIIKNIPESSFGSVNSELLEKEITTSMLTSTGIQNSKNDVANPNSLLPKKAQEPQAPKARSHTRTSQLHHYPRRRVHRRSCTQG